MMQVNRVLKPDKWQAAFDSDGKAFGFQKTLKSIVLGVCCLTMKKMLRFYLENRSLGFPPLLNSHFIFGRKLS